MSFADCSSTTTSTSCDSIPMKVEIKVGVQYRFDHLVGDHARINPMRSVRPKASVVGAASGAASPSAVTIPGVKPPSSTAHLPHDLADMVHSFKDRDPFYPPEKLYKMIEPLADDFLALVRPALRMETHRRVLQRREAVLFLNKFPFTENHGVITSSESYYVSMPDITPTQIYDTLAVSCEFLRLCTAPGAPPSSPDADRAPPAPELFWWPSIVWNYMPSSAGSIIHPHMQCFCETTAPPAAAALMAATARWAQKHGSSSGNTSAAGTAALTTYHDALITRERALLAANAAAAVLAANETKTDSAATAVSWPERSRFVGEVDGVVVIAPFAPRTNRELHICVPVRLNAFTFNVTTFVLRLYNLYRRVNPTLPIIALGFICDNLCKQHHVLHQN